MIKKSIKHSNLLESFINNYTLQKFFLIAAYTIVLLALILRIPYGTEITDEIYYIAEGYIVTQGATPFANMWVHVPGFALLNAPFVWLYVFITGSTEGILLYFRIISLLPRLILVLLTCVILKPYIKTRTTALWLLPFIAFVPHSVIPMSYNTWAITLMMLSCITFVRAVLSTEKNKKIFFGSLAGALIVLAILAYPTAIITGIFLVLLLFIHESYHHSGHKALLGYLLGSFLTALILMFFLVYRAGDLRSIFEGLKIIIEDNPYLKLPKEITKESLQIFFIYIIKHWIFLVLISYIFIYIPVLKNNIKSISILLFVFSFISYHSFVLYSHYLRTTITMIDYVQITDIICRLFFPIPLVLYPLIKQKNKEAQTLLLFVFLPALIFYLSSSFSSIYGIKRNFYFLVQGTLLTIPFLYWTLSDLALQKTSKNLGFWGALYIASMFAFVFLLNYYGFIYRDMPIKQLKYKVESGIYKNLYTTKERGEGLELLEKTIKSETNANERILFMDNTPMAYLMTEAQHCAPSTWDIQLYSYKFTEDTLLRKYFVNTGKMPDKIIYIFTGIDKILSIDSENYKFNSFVNNNYELTSNIDGFFPIRIYGKALR